MIFTGNNFRLTPKTNQLRFEISGLTVKGTGNSEIGFSGEGNVLKFGFVNSRILSPSGKFISTFNTGEPVFIKGLIDTGNYQYTINQNDISNRNTKPNFNIQKFFINCTGATITSDIKLFSNNISYSINVNENFTAINPLTGSIKNNSSIDFRIFDSFINYLQSNPNSVSGKVTGEIGNSSSYNFTLTDLNTSRFNNTVEFDLGLYSSIGTILTHLASNRVSGSNIVLNNIYCDSEGNELFVLFDGSGTPANQFKYIPNSQFHLLTYFVSSSNLHGEQKPKSVDIKLENFSHSEGQSYKSEYITGFSLTSSGEYLYIPIAKFTGYYYVSDLDWNLNSLLLSNGCSGNVPITFTGSGNLGRNASGNLLTTRVFLSDVYDVGINQYYLSTGFKMQNAGTGYLKTPKAILNTGIFSNCYDVANKYGFNYLIYTPFSGSGRIEPLASYLTGEILVKTGLVSGGLKTGYIVTGLEITNPGSGYNSTYIPKISFERLTGDTLTGNASGIFSLKSTGIFQLTENWTLNTGISSYNTVLLTGLTGRINLDYNQNYFTIQVNYSGLDNTEPLICKTTTTFGDKVITRFITGNKSYDTSTGFLKKKPILGFSKFLENAELSFFLTQDDLEKYYSSDEYLNNGEIFNLGDLDF